MIIDLHKEENDTVVTLKGRMDAVCAPDLENLLEAKIKEGDMSFILDFSELEYISSAGLQCILAVAKTLENRQGGLVLASLHGTVKEVFEISGFDTLFPVYDSVEDAIRQGHNH